MTTQHMIIAGGRDFRDHALMLDRIQELEAMGKIDEHTVLVCGMARGADMLGHKVWSSAGLQIEEMPADWDKFGKRAGFIRNEEMAQIADFALVFWDGQSKGTKHMIEAMDRLNKPAYVVRYTNPPVAVPPAMKGL